MVMATAAGSRRASAALLPREESGGSGAESAAAEISAEEARALHERLVAAVRAAAGEPRRGRVWAEHSYARARGEARARELLPPRAPPPDDELDVERLEPEREPSPAPPDDAGDDDGDDDWEARVAALAPSAAHARLAAAAGDALRRLRLARLAGAGGEAARHAARRLRLALAPLWAWGGPPAARPAPWLHAALLAHLPRSLRRLYDEVLAQLRRTTPRLAERLQPGRLPAAAADPLGAVGPAVGPAAPGPVLLWLCAGPPAADARWTRRLRALLYLRELRAPAAGGPPDVWCAQTAAALRADLQEAIADAGERGAVVCGAGAGAALAAALLSGAGGVGGARGAVLLAPPPRTAEGGGAGRGLRLPALLVAGGGGAARAAARRARLLLVAGADAALRLPRRRRLRLRLSQHALDAAIVEEVYRWALEVNDSEREHERESPAASPEPAPAPAPAPSPAPPPRSNRSIEIVEGRVVSRVCGGTPLALLPPRRAREPSAADILHMPIVFADDEPAPPPLTVTSGDPRGGRVTRVVVASRGRAGARDAALVLRRAD